MSKIKIRTEDVFLRFEIDESVLIYKELTFLEKKRILFPHLLNGRLTEDNAFEFMYDVVMEIVTGWENVLDTDTDEPIEFKSEYLKKFEPDTMFDFFKEVVGPMFQELIEIKDVLVAKGETEPDAIEYKESLKNTLKDPSVKEDLEAIEHVIAEDIENE